MLSYWIWSSTTEMVVLVPVGLGLAGLVPGGLGQVGGFVGVPVATVPEIVIGPEHPVNVVSAQTRATSGAVTGRRWFSDMGVPFGVRGSWVGRAGRECRVAI